MSKAKLEAGSKLYYVESNSILSHEVKKVGRKYAYIGTRREVDLDNLVFKSGNYQTRYFLTEAEALASLQLDQARSQCEKKLRLVYTSYGPMSKATLEEIQKLDEALSAVLKHSPDLHGA